MLVSLGEKSRGRKEGEGGAVALLAACHTRIRHYSGLAVRLAIEDCAPSERAEVAEAVARYFGVALPLHVEDEERSLSPRLAALADTRALADMTEQHEEIERRLADLLPKWRVIAAEPQRFADVGPSLRVPSEELRALLERHLDAEERLVLPAVARLPEAERDAIAAEIRARRT